MRKRIYAIYLCFLLLLTGCGSKKDNKVIETTAKVATTEVETTGADTEETTEETPTTAEEDKWNVPINYTWNPHVYGDILKELYGEEDEENLYRLIDAVLAGEESCDFDVNNSGIIWDIDLIMQQICPLFDKLVSDYSFEAGVTYFEYRYDKTQHDEIIEEFKDSVECIICSSVMETDNQTMTALAIYHFYSWIIEYDYAAVGDFNADITPYRALVEYKGICQSFSSAYTYLLLQCGITAVYISSFNDDAAHQWTLVKLNGNYYHMDPTYEEGYGGEGLVFFGMTDDMRQIYDFPIDKFNVMNIWGSSDIQANDYTFAELWSVYMIDKIVRDESGMTIYDANGGDGQAEGILIPY